MNLTRDQLSLYFHIKDHPGVSKRWLLANHVKGRTIKTLQDKGLILPQGAGELETYQLSHLGWLFSEELKRLSLQTPYEPPEGKPTYYMRLSKRVNLEHGSFRGGVGV